ncbi:hypothetical protein LEP1GSC050_1116 [Leptospira broomii serovar Hurstbridge str. 5399]|uniref:Uncharacterized protein n=1 Tax=Leptospira broomii serovar Hurstbridge str. 5399 TaxID=1049789 RepID=T0F841_9LEPT|nr:GldG family protein [Leptospira broomii]EQA47310.1 hypothetical protein LEP1GSC050_1116 [Leptospira broomii serovar Hurstbridge str. 5399]
MKDLLKPFLEISKRRWFVLANLFLFFLLMNGIVSSGNCRKDLSRSQRFELTVSTRKLLQNLESILYIDAFYSSKVPGEYKARLDLTKEILSEIASVGGKKVVLRFFDPDSSQEDALKASESGIEPQILQKSDRNSASVKQAYLGLTLTLGSETEILPVAFFAEQIEYQVLSGIRKIQRKDQDSGLVLLKTHGSLSPQNPGPGSGKDTVGVFVHQVLETEIGVIPELNLESDEIPEGTSVLLWIGSGSLSQMERYRIDQFLVNGGSLILLSKTMDFRMESSGNRMGILTGEAGAGMAQTDPFAHDLNSFLEHYGIRILSNIVLDPDNSLPMGALIEVEPGVLGRYPYPAWIVASHKNNTLNDDSPFTKEQENLLLPWSSSIELIPGKQKNALGVPLIFSGSDAEIRSDRVMLGEKQLQQTPIRPNGGPFVLGAIVEGPLESYFADKPLPKGVGKNGYLSRSPKDKFGRILVLATPYLVSDILAFPDYREIFRDTNIPFILNAIDILSGDTDLLAARSKQSLILKMNPVSPKMEIFASLINVLGIPLFVSLYAFLHLRRRRRNRQR